ncbi:helix-turn-helix domain-containing protein [Aureimonas psammosilenae]|uniref:transcriptional regulator n=1 Tax=Aureimonas psammosilenae TaxID=2495496 RepID=UPI001F26D214|nr:transcriptional regulator [Aureimonas psammosilenae]
MSIDLPINAMQCRAARACLDWSSRKLSSLAGFEANELRRFEAGISTPKLTKLRALRTVFEDAGVELLFENKRGVGVRMICDDQLTYEHDR